jgi:hypothetical protein
LLTVDSLALLAPTAPTPTGSLVILAAFIKIAPKQADQQDKVLQVALGNQYSLVSFEFFTAVTMTYVFF